MACGWADVVVPGSRTEADLVRRGMSELRSTDILVNEQQDIMEGYVPSLTVVFEISLSLVVLLVIKPTTLAKGANQLCLATSKRSALFLGFGTRILLSKSRAWGVTYSGNVSGVETIYLYNRLILSPSGFSGSSSKGR